jgi:DNA-directed RNA polymerase specialized sigma subunit
MARSTSPQPPSNRNRSAGCSPLPDKALRLRNLRVQTYRQLVRPIALHYSRCSSEACEDLTQVGLLGLIRAAELYRRDRSVPFESFARPHMHGLKLINRTQATYRRRQSRAEAGATACTDSSGLHLGLESAHQQGKANVVLPER